MVLAAADAYHDAHPAPRCRVPGVGHPLAAERHDLSWLELRVDLDEALTRPAAMRLGRRHRRVTDRRVIVGTGGEGTDPSIARHTEPVRRAIASLLRSQRTTIC